MNSIVYTNPEMEQIVIKQDLIYKEEKGKKYLFDICYPLNFDTSQKYPLVLLISGGSSSSLTLKEDFKEVLLSWGKLLGTKGFITVHFIWNYKTPNNINEILTYLINNSDNLNIDTKRMSTFSFSRGVKLSFDTILRTQYESIRCMIAYYGMISPSIIKKNDFNYPPTLIVLAEKDKFFKPDCNNDYIERLKENGTQIQLLVHETGEHAFDMINDDRRSREIILETVEFLIKNGK